MDFFEHKDVALKKSKYLVLLFFLSVVGILLACILCIYLGMWWVGGSMQEANELFKKNILEISVALFIVLSTIVFGTLFKIFSLRKGGRSIAEMMDARLISEDTKDLDEQKALNVVQEMVIASGMSKVPEIYRLEGEDSINAFAAGWNEDDAVIGLTDGAIQKLSRDELQAVIGHEISHIQHGDMNQNIRLMGVIHGLLVLAYLGQFLIRSSLYSSIGSRRSKDGRAVIAAIGVGVALIIAGSVGMLLGNIIKAAISRQREYLADASSVQFTRMPDSMENALRKIVESSKEKSNYLNEAHASQMSHMFFAKGVRSLFATHPPVEDRIRRINPNAE